MEQILEATGESAYAVYDKMTGVIVNIHRSIVLRGADAPSKDEDEAHAVRHAAKATGRDATDFAIISINPGDIRRGQAYVVDVARKELRELPPRN
jgi:hypothetical protein